MKKVYYYLYYKLYHLGILLSDDAINEWKPLVTILVLQVLLLVQALNWYTVYTGHVVEIAHPTLILLPVVSLLGIGNYRFFLHQNKWKTYFKEFRSYSRPKKFIGTIAVIILVSTILGG